VLGLQCIGVSAQILRLAFHSHDHRNSRIKSARGRGCVRPDVVHIAVDRSGGRRGRWWRDQIGIEEPSVLVGRGGHVALAPHTTSLRLAPVHFFLRPPSRLEASTVEPGHAENDDANEDDRPNDDASDASRRKGRLAPQCSLGDPNGIGRIDRNPENAEFAIRSG
jgi:hypothetical protein